MALPAPAEAYCGFLPELVWLCLRRITATAFSMMMPLPLTTTNSTAAGEFVPVRANGIDLAVSCNMQVVTGSGFAEFLLVGSKIPVTAWFINGRPLPLLGKPLDHQHSQ